MRVVLGLSGECGAAHLNFCTLLDFFSHFPLTPALLPQGEGEQSPVLENDQSPAFSNALAAILALLSRIDAVARHEFHGFSRKKT